MMKTDDVTLVTIVGEVSLEQHLVQLVRREGASGFTISAARGEGSRGNRSGSLEPGNVRLEALVSAEVADAILERLARDYFTNYGVVAWLTPVKVVRGAKYLGAA